MSRALWGRGPQSRRERGVRWCKGRSGREDRTPLDLLVTVEEARAPSNFKQLPGANRAQAQNEREEIADRHMLGVLRVKGHAHWMRIQVVKES